MAEKFLPVSVLSGTDYCTISWGGKSAPWPPKPPPCFYHLVVLDRTNLSPVANGFCSDFKTVPPEVKPFGGNDKYLLLVSTMSLIPSMRPQGDLLAFLTANGPGRELARGVQICQVVDPATNYFNYCLISVMGTREGKDAYSISQRIPLPLPMQLLLTGSVYTPVDQY
ncbi:MAG: hypothetical protein KJ950_06335 [Proteobacteria bacterium]|nr:hypothetical protein [Pseudomonadota bacterium]MBU1687150.1 hypothetical protein [Pseudomonadota bacterium]